MSLESAVPKPKAGVLAVDYTAGCGWCVRNDHGLRISSWYPRRESATSAALKLKESHDRLRKRGERPCMCCGHNFLSEGIHNRLCDTCRRRDAAPDPVLQSVRAVARGGARSRG